MKAVPKLSAKRRAVASTAVAASVIAALGGGMASASPVSGHASGKAITYLYFTNGPDLHATKTLIARFDHQTGATVNLDVVPYGNEAQILQADVSAGRPPAVVETTNPATFGNQLVNLGKALGKQWVATLSPNLIGQGEYHGQLVGLPNQLTVTGPFVNVTMFKKAGVAVPTATKGWTWSQMVADAKKVQKANGTQFAIAIDHSGARISNAFCQFGAFLYGAKGTGSMSGPAALKAMNYMSGLFKQNVISKDAYIAAGTNYAAGSDEFLAKQTPVLLSGSWEVASFLTSAPFKWAAVPNPKAKYTGGMSGGNYMVAFKKSNDPTLAEKFIKFMSEPQNQAYMSTISDTIPSAKALAKPGALHFKGAAGQAMGTFTTQASLMPAGCNLSEANPGFTAAADGLMAQITEVMAGQKSSSAAVNTVLAIARKNNGA